MSSITTCKTTAAVQDNVQGLREQIIANAAVLFPQVMALSPSYLSNGTVKPDEVFAVITTASNEGMRAILVVGGDSGSSSLAKKMVAKGAAAGGIEEALGCLLQVISEGLGWYTETLLGEIENSEEAAGGEINYLMVEAGFHFAAEERLESEK